MSSRKVPIYIAIAAFAVGTLVPISYYYLSKSDSDPTITASTNNNKLEDECEQYSYRLKGYQFTKPLLFAEDECESKNLQDIKSQITSKLEQMKNSGIINSASVYLRVFQNGEWTSYNQPEKFNPGSLMKVPVMMTYLKLADKNPDILNKKVKFAPDDSYIPTQTYNSKTIEPGKEYTIKDLINYMIIYSDNNATHLLNERMDISVFKKMFVDIGIAEPNVSDRFYQISSKDFSNFLKVLFNASYLSKEMSDYAIQLLTKSDYQDGFLSGVPKEVIVAHKFGEGGTDKLHELHETGIFYTTNKTYLLTVMTRGNELKNLPHVLSGISKDIYQYMVK